LDEITCGDAAVQAYLRRAAGYSLTGVTREECCFLCVGAGRNGKTKFLEALKFVLGDYALAIRPEALSARDGNGGVPSDLADLAGARFVISSEFAQGGRLDVARLKSLTGGDTVRARFLYQEHFEFRPQLKLWLATNHLPKIGERQPAIWQRLKVIPFHATFPPERQDKHLDEQLRAVAPAILAWAVAGCQQWLREGLGEPPSVTAATASYRADDDPLAAFLAEYCQTGVQLQVRAQALREAYNAWLAGEQEGAVSGRTFAQLMREQGYETRRDSKGMCYIGLALR
jgi:putative DNA primase/helicase